MDIADTLDADTALQRCTTLATRNLKPFRGLATPVTKPWQALTSR